MAVFENACGYVLSQPDTTPQASGVYWVGIAVLRSWEFMYNLNPLDHPPEIAAMMGIALRGHYYKSCVGLLQFPLLAVASTSQEVASTPLPNGALTSRSLLLQLEGQYSQQNIFSVHRGPGHDRGPLDLNNVLDLWANHFNISSRHATFTWHSFFAMARSFSCGFWPCDITYVNNKDKKKPFRIQDNSPPRDLVLEYLRQIAGRGDSQSPEQQPSIQCIKKHPGCVTKEFDTGHILRALRIDEGLKQREKEIFQKQLKAVSAYLDPLHGKERLAELYVEGLDDPGRSTLCTARVRLDVTCMLMRRKINAERKYYEFINFDASPQHGLEIMGMQETKIDREDVYNKTFDDVNPDALKSHRAPLVGMGQGKTGLLDKAVTITHQRWLEHGPAVFQMRQANRNARVGLTDMGTELGVGDHLDIIENVIKQTVVPQETLQQDRLAL
jgi:hypothetical protein